MFWQWSLVTQNAHADERCCKRHGPKLKPNRKFFFRQIEQDVAETAKQKHQRDEWFAHVPRKTSQKQRRRRLEQRPQPKRQTSRRRVFRELGEDRDNYQHNEHGSQLNRACEQPIEFHTCTFLCFLCLKGFQKLDQRALV